MMIKRSISLITSSYLNYPATKKIIRILEEDYSLDPDEYSAILKTVDNYLKSITSSRAAPAAKKMIKSNPDFFNDSLTSTQKQIICNIVRDDFESGQIENDSDELFTLFEEMGEFDGVENLAVSYYFELANENPDEFYEDNSDWSEDYADEYELASSKNEVSSSTCEDCSDKKKSSKKSIDQEKVTSTINLIQQNYPSYKDGTVEQIASDFGLNNDEAECVMTALNPIQEETEPEETLEVVKPRKVVKQSRVVEKESERSGGLF